MAYAPIAMIPKALRDPQPCQNQRRHRQNRLQSQVRQLSGFRLQEMTKPGICRETWFGAEEIQDLGTLRRCLMSLTFWRV